MNISSKSIIYLKSFLIIQIIIIALYTSICFYQEGFTLFSVMLTNISALNWSGQFNLDFSSYLILSALWVLWRNKFSKSSIFISISALILGIVFFAPYFLYLLYTQKNDIKKVLIGDR